MRRFTMNLMFAAAGLMAVAVSANAQIMKAEVPFTFQTGAKVMTAGTYEVRLDRHFGSTYFLMRNVDTGQGGFLPITVESDAARAWKADGHPRLRFDCAASRCVLRQIWPGSVHPVFDVNGPKLGSGEAIHTAEIPLSRAGSN